MRSSRSIDTDAPSINPNASPAKGQAGFDRLQDSLLCVRVKRAFVYRGNIHAMGAFQISRTTFFAFERLLACAPVCTNGAANLARSRCLRRRRLSRLPVRADWHAACNGLLAA